MYVYKYLKYKNKYLDLKNKQQIGGDDNDNCKKFLREHLKKKLVVYKLNIPSQWKFQSLPKEFQQPDTKLEEKIWFIKRSIRMKTYKKNMGPLMSKYILPRDLCLFRPCLSDDELKSMWNYFETLFGEYKQLNIMNSTQEGRGLIYLFTGDAGTRQYARETLSFLKNYNLMLYNLIDKIVKYIMDIYCVRDKDEKNNFIDKMQIIILKYTSHSGIWLHIDNVARYDQGPIITISVGPKKIYYDLTPTLLHNDKKYSPIRVEVGNGDLVIMDGSSRMEWAHGLPYDMTFSVNKYSILIKMDRFGKTNIIYNKTLDLDISSSAILCDNY